MNNQASARLVLKTSSLATADTNTSYSKYSFNNIDLVTLLGPLYERYDLFNLQLKSIVSGVGGTNGTVDAATLFGLTLDDLNVGIYLSGLPFINQTYVYGNTNNNEVLLTNFIFKRDTSASSYLPNNNITFSKNQLNCSLNFRYENINSGSLPNTTAAFPDVVYIFEIYGVGEPKDINQIMNQRINI